MAGKSTEIRQFDTQAIAAAAALIRDGQPVAVPTETVYGLAADATNPRAVARIYEAKGRPIFNPLIVHVPDLAAAERLGIFSDEARALAEQHWPGPLTLVVPLTDNNPVASLVTAGLPSIAIRVPAHPAMRALLEASGRPLAAPSANASGRISPTRAKHVLASLDGRIPLVIDGGQTAHGLESTIVAFTGGAPRLLRPGPIEVPDGAPVFADTVEAPGMLASHYAPAKPLRLNATEALYGEWLIGFGSVTGDVSLSPSGEIIEAAARLFDLLHEADANACTAIAVAPVPHDGVGRAINDRLARAAAPRN
jgi:L-threonylcarbamoyladenylate synthase